MEDGTVLVGMFTGIILIVIRYDANTGRHRSSSSSISFAVFVGCYVSRNGIDLTGTRSGLSQSNEVDFF